MADRQRLLDTLDRIESALHPDDEGNEELYRDVFRIIRDTRADVGPAAAEPPLRSRTAPRQPTHYGRNASMTSIVKPHTGEQPEAWQFGRLLQQSGCTVDEALRACNGQRTGSRDGLHRLAFADGSSGMLDLIARKYEAYTE